jgi:ATP-dependent DNA helicase RecQ
VDTIARAADVPRRKTRIVLTLLKRHGMVREHRGGVWERTADDVTEADLSRELIDYEDRRRRDRAKLSAMIRYCQTARCRTRLIREYFGEKPPADFRCGHCDIDVSAPASGRNGAMPEPTANRPANVRTGPAPRTEIGRDLSVSPGEEVVHDTFGRGIVVAVEGERAEVDFGGHGVRTVRSEFLTHA